MTHAHTIKTPINSTELTSRKILMILLLTLLFITQAFILALSNFYSTHTKLERALKVTPMPNKRMSCELRCWQICSKCAK